MAFDRVQDRYRSGSIRSPPYIVLYICMYIYIINLEPRFICVTLPRLAAEPCQGQIARFFCRPMRGISHSRTAQKTRL